MSRAIASRAINFGKANNLKTRIKYPKGSERKWQIKLKGAINSLKTIRTSAFFRLNNPLRKYSMR